MLTQFGTLFAACRNYDSLTQLLTLLNFHKKDVSRGTLAKWMFHVEQICLDVKKI